MTPTPKDIATAVPADFRLPHNTTRTMADVWADWDKKHDGLSTLSGVPRRRAGGHRLHGRVCLLQLAQALRVVLNWA